MSDLLKKYCDLDQLQSLLEQSEKKGTLAIDAETLKTSLKQRVRGQDHVIDDLARVISRQFAKVSRRRPVANLLFVGPTGTGKSELCKALAEFLFGNDNNRIQFDCGQFKDGTVSRLVGSPQGYVGGSGELTKAMLANKRRIVVFDEIEKAHSNLFDLFLSMMGDGRLADQRSGKEADFTESIIVLTSNAEQDQLTKLQSQIEDPDELNNAVRIHLQESGTFRPEIIGRIDRIYVFKHLEGIVQAEIVLLKMRKLAGEYGLDLQHVNPQLMFEAVQRSQKVKDFGARQMEQLVEDMLAEAFLAAQQQGAKRIRIDVDDEGDMVINPA